MNTINEKTAYLKGLLEGMNYSADSNEGKLFRCISDCLELIGSEFSDMADDTNALRNEIEELEQDLSDVEEIVMSRYDDDDEDGFDFDFDDDELECPHCGEKIFLETEDLLDSDDFIVCPSCNKKIELECEECDCDDE